MSLFPVRLQQILDRLHAASAAQEPELGAYFGERARAGDIDWNRLDDRSLTFLSGQMVALERDKCEFAFLLAKALRAKGIVEVGGSHGVSALYLAQAVKETGGGVVISTENVSAKASVARANAAEAGLSEFIDLREGDLRQTLQNIEVPVDLVLMDIWTEMARPALELIHPRLRQGAVILTDNTAQHPGAYADYFAFVTDPANGYATRTLPFQGGLEFTVKL